MTASTGQPPAPAQQPPAPPAPAPAGTPGSDEKNLAGRVDSIEHKLDQLLDQAHGQAAAHTEARLDRGTDMEEAARREVQRLRDEEAAQQQQQAEQSAMDQLKADVASLKEIRPEPPQRYIERLMWGSRRRD